MASTFGQQNITAEKKALSVVNGMDSMHQILCEKLAVRTIEVTSVINILCGGREEGVSL